MNGRGSIVAMRRCVVKFLALAAATADIKAVALLPASPKWDLACFLIRGHDSSA